MDKEKRVKTEVLMIRVTPEDKARIQTLCKQERRSMSEMVMYLFDKEAKKGVVV